MSRHFSRLLVFGIAGLTSSAVPAADRLPKDGTWARYFVHNKRANGVEDIMHTTIRFVGTVTEHGERYRWIEWTDAFEIDGNDGKTVIRKDVQKFLVSEKSLRTSPHPLRYFIRGWRGEEGKTAAAIEPDRLHRETADVQGITLLFLPGVLKTTKPTRNSRAIDYQQGQLRIRSGRAGTYRAVRHAITAPLVYTWKTDYELWLHKDVPLGMASVKMKLVFIRKAADGTTTVRNLATTEYSVEAWGTNAKSALPNAR
ncbi:MAG: hypothetical protein ACE5KM_22265 [Planctomycetaceae bacterium]